MAKILRGPVSMDEVVNFVASVAEAYSQNRGYGRNQIARLDEIDPDIAQRYLIGPNGTISLPSSSNLDSRQILPYNHQLAQGSTRIFPHTRSALSVYISNQHSGYSDRLQIATDIVDITTLRDGMIGQTFSASVREYLIQTNYVRVNNGENSKESFERHLDKMIPEAQDRIQQGVAFAAFQMIKKLS